MSCKVIYIKKNKDRETETGKNREGAQTKQIGRKGSLTFT